MVSVSLDIHQLLCPVLPMLGVDPEVGGGPVLQPDHRLHHHPMTLLQPQPQSQKKKKKWITTITIIVIERALISKHLRGDSGRWQPHIGIVKKTKSKPDGS